MASLGKTENCTNCDRLLKCGNEKKSPFYKCHRYVVMPIKQQNFVDTLFDKTPLGRPADSGSQGRFGASRGGELEDGDEDNLLKLVESALDDKSGSGLVARDIRVDDRDIIELPNFLAWNLSKTGSGVKPFSRQAWIGIKLFAEWCQYCSKDKKMMQDIEDCPIDMDVEEMGERIQMLNYGVCPKCKRTKLDLFDDNELDPYLELVLCLGQRSGKSIMTSMFVAYLVHKFLKLQKPTDVYGVLGNTTLVGTFVGMTYDRATKLLWAPVKDLLTDSPWFKQYHEVLDHFGTKYGEEIGVRNETFFHYKHRKLFLHPQGPSKRKLRGDTRIIAAIDELGWFPVGEQTEDNEKMNATEVYTALERSLKTVRGAARRLWKRGIVNVPTAYDFNLSSPSSMMDKIMQLVRQYDNSRMALALQKATWEINPNLTRDDFDKEYLDDPVKAERDFGAQPPLMDNVFIENTEAVISSFSTSTKNAVDYKYEFFKNKDGKNRQFATLTNIRQPNIAPPSILVLDAGYSGNSFAMAIGHISQRGKALHESVKAGGMKRTTTIDWPVLIDIIPRKGVKLSHAKIMREVIRKLIEPFNIQCVLADRWNSLLLLHEIEEDFKIFAQQYSVRRTDFDLAKSYLEGGNFWHPKPEMGYEATLNVGDNYPQRFDSAPAAHLMLQYLTVRDAGKTVTKGDDLTDDLFRCVVLGTTHLLNPDWVRKHLKDTKRRQPAALGAIASRGILGGGGAMIGGSNFGSLGSVRGRST